MYKQDAQLRLNRANLQPSWMHPRYFLPDLFLLPKLVQVHGVLCLLLIPCCAFAGKCDRRVDHEK